MAKDQPDEQESDVRRVSREGLHASINPKLLRKFQSRCWLELRCNPEKPLKLEKAGTVSEQMLA